MCITQSDVTRSRMKAKKLRMEKSYESRSAVITASPSIVSVVTRPGFLSGTGFIIECNPNDNGDGDRDHEDNMDNLNYVSTVLAPAVLFAPRHHLAPQFQVDVYVSDGEKYKGELVVHDAHYNIAAISIKSNSRLPTAVVRGLDDAESIFLTDYNQDSSIICPRSNLFKIQPFSDVFIVQRSPQLNLKVRPGEIRPYICCLHGCKELCWVSDDVYEGEDGAAVVNSSGEVIGIMLSPLLFLPSNLLSKWWSYYKTYRKVFQPWHGVDIINLNTAKLDFLEQFRNKFPNIGTGAVVSMVEKDTPADCSGIMPGDVIVKCDGESVRSRLEFFEKMWASAGKTMELTLLRVSDGKQYNPSIMIGDTPSDKIYRWKDCN